MLECDKRGYLLVEQGMAATKASPWVGLLGGEDTDLPPGANYASIAPRTHYAEAPGYRKQVISVVGNNEDVILGADADWVNIYTGRDVSGIRITATGKVNRKIWLNGNASYAIAEINIEDDDNYSVSGNGATLEHEAGAGERYYIRFGRVRCDPPRRG
ncbi:hypothetical protein [Paracoccus sp. (in: a-proteobacteria)]|uniref:hypothetical protein n=1 Tax=Paracoccus sp. TaxID=267 RepID=UPI0035AFBF7F